MDLLTQRARETDAGLLLVSEPNTVPRSDNWFSSKNKKTAIYCDLNLTRMRCQLVKQGLNFVVVQCGPYLIMSVYISPSLGLRDFNSILDEFSLVLSGRVGKLIHQWRF